MERQTAKELRPEEGGGRRVAAGAGGGGCLCSDGEANEKAIKLSAENEWR